MTSFYDDLTIDELLRDPMTRAVMKADGVDAPVLEAMLRSVASKIGINAAQSKEGARESGQPSRRAIGSRFLQSIARVRETTSGCNSGLCGA